MALTADEIAANLDTLIDLHVELGEVVEAVRKARADGEVSEQDRLRIRRKAGKLARKATPLLMGLVVDIID